jgi:hypothetical protein
MISGRCFSLRSISFCSMLLPMLLSMLLTIFLTLSVKASATGALVSDSVDQSMLETRRFLELFHREPKNAMNSPLIKTDDLGHLVPFTYNAFAEENFSGDDLRSEYFAARDQVRRRICEFGDASCPANFRLRPAASGDDLDQVDRFIEGNEILRTLKQIENAGLVRASLDVMPWSDSFWPMQKGLIARRWRDQSAPNNRIWAENFAYVQNHPASQIPRDILSPSEKYDFLVGAGDFLLTQKMWEAGKYWHDLRGSVPSWAGLCHGWAPAAFMTQNPQRAVRVLGADGQPLTFYPSDIKALASLAWAESPPRVKFIGSRCHTQDPKEDEIGRVLDGGCFDVNPGAWHLAVVNHLGLQQRSFVFDATYDYQVWNYPIQAYRYYYFHPQTLATSSHLAGSVVSIKDFTMDKFKSYRAPNARFVVGIAMELTYSIPTQPSSRHIARASSHTVKYVYDLELDSAGLIIGGEWYSNFHPDFIWSVPSGARTQSKGEVGLGQAAQWDGSGVLPVQLQDAARVSSENGQVLGAVVQALVFLSQLPPP